MIKIGVDPDIKKSGFCILLGNQVTELTTLSFFDLTAHLLELKEYYDGCLQKYVVVIEKGEDNSNLFNAVGAGIATYNSPKSKRKSMIERLKSALNVAAQAGMRTGKNFEVTELLVEFCEREKIPYKTYVPKSAKWSHNYTKKLVKNLPKRTNEEKRDAIRAAFMG